MPPTVRSTIRRRRLAAGALVGALALGGTGWAIAAAGSGATESGSATGTATSVESSDAAADDATSQGAADTADTADSDVIPVAVAAQLDFVRENWQREASDQFGFIPENDCVNFASQSLLARGWAVDDEWWFDASGDPYAHATAWISSTALMEYLQRHPERATALTDDQRASVKVGDIVQFDWDDSGDRDHTGIVTSVATDTDGQLRVRYAGHTDATWDRSVDWAITELHPGGVAYYWSVPA